MRKHHKSIFQLKAKGKIYPGLFVLLGVCFMVLLSCEHDPVAPIKTPPEDTIGNPLDTMVFDTTDEEVTGTPCSPDSVYFSRDILPLLKSNCAKSGCHDVSSHQEDIILDSYVNLMSSGIVKPFDLNDSDLFDVITETDPDKRMPELPNQKLNTDQIALISKWILQGAKDLTCNENAGSCDTTDVSYSGYIAPLMSTNCVGCHSGAAPSGNILLNSHAAVQAVALNGRLLSATTWANGYQPMPKGSARLSDCKINKLKSWINNGAPNN